jgi:hypothetical protein
VHTCFQTAYNPNLMYHSGVAMPPRPSDMLVQNFDIFTIDDIKNYERRVMNAIDFGYVKDVSAHSSAQSPCQNIINIHTK